MDPKSVFYAATHNDRMLCWQKILVKSQATKNQTVLWSKWQNRYQSFVANRVVRWYKRITKEDVASLNYQHEETSHYLNI